jgi:nickel transport protein
MRAVVLLLFLLIVPFSAFAHKISAFVDFEGDKVTVFSYFNDGAPVKGGKVEVYDKKTGKLLLTGKTDENGEFSFKLESPKSIKVVVTGELGHKAVSELDLSSGTETEKVESKTVKEEKAGEFQKVNEELLRKIVREEVEKQVRPIKVELSEIRKELSGTSTKDVFAGFGWILGIFGAVSLVLSRRKDGE